MELEPTRTADDSRARADGDEPWALLSQVFPARGAMSVHRSAVLGRGGALRPWLERDALVSREHARLEHHDGQWLLTDLGSRNGTKVDGRPLEKGATVRLGRTATVRLGDTLLVFRAGACSDAQDDDPALPGRSLPMQALRRQLRERATGDRPLLILGETGVGKEHVVRWMHAVGGQSHGPLEALNCGLLAREMARAELFGIEAGTATGVAARRGAVALARGGTLFLDEVGELPAEVQPAFLRFLQDGRFRPLGASADIESDARVVAATHHDLAHEAAAPTFRRDLYHRLTEDHAPLVVPPLRDRPEDLVAWAELFLHGRERALTAGAAEALLVHPWLGNLRELRSVLNTAHARVPAGQPLSRLSLGLHEVHDDDATPSPSSSPPPSDTHEDQARTRVELDAEGLRALLGELRGNMSQLAARLGTSRRSAYRACLRAGLDPDDFRAGG